jgi:hypothetical protein
MACTNAKLTRYIVTLERGCGDWAGLADGDNDIVLAMLPDATEVKFGKVTKVGGLTLGEEGEITIPYWDREGMTGDGKRKFENVTMQVRVDEKFVQGVNSGEANAMAHFFNVRERVKFNIHVYLVDRGWQVLYEYVYTDSTLKKWSQEDQELGSPKLGLIDLTFLPDNAKLFDSLGNQIVGKDFSDDGFPVSSPFINGFAVIPTGV